MDIKAIASVAGVLGFIISVATFVLTRIERRNKLVVELFLGDISQYTDEYSLNSEEEYHELVKIRVTNIGGQPVILNTDSFYISALGNTMDRNKTDWCGIDNIPSPLSVGQSCEVAVFSDAFLDLLKIKNLDKYCNEEDYQKTLVSIEAGVFDYKGKKYCCSNFKYFHYVGEFERNT